MPIKLLVSIEGMLKGRTYTTLSRVVKEFKCRLTNLDQYTNEFKVILTTSDLSIGKNRIKELILKINDLSSYCYASVNAVVFQSNDDVYNKLRSAITRESALRVKIGSEVRISFKVSNNVYIIVINNEDRKVMKILPLIVNRDITEYDLIHTTALNLRLDCLSYVKHDLINVLISFINTLVSKD